MLLFSKLRERAREREREREKTMKSGKREMYSYREERGREHPRLFVFLYARTFAVFVNPAVDSVLLQYTQ